jgi:hypothetical protein
LTRLALTSCARPLLGWNAPEPTAAPAAQLHGPTLVKVRSTVTLLDVPTHPPLAWMLNDALAERVLNEPDSV